MEPPELSLDAYLDSLDPEARRRTIQRESLWELQDPRETQLAGLKPITRGRRRRRSTFRIR